tara:strand:- start:4081 stop:5547 length:1467 start_codon:yes stop_codon:yes gene_type:complete
LLLSREKNGALKSGGGLLSKTRARTFETKRVVARVYYILSTPAPRFFDVMLRAIVRGTSLAKKRTPSGRLAQEDADVHKLFLATQFRERLLDVVEGDDGPTTREAVANRVLEASTRCTSLERKEKVRKSIQRQLTSVGLDLMGRTGDVSETGTTNRNAVRPSEAIENEEGLFLSKPATVGTVVSLYPGIVYAKQALRFLKGFPNVAKENAFLLARFDDTVVDAKPWEEERRRSSSKNNTSGSNGSSSTSGGDNNSQSRGWPGFPLREDFEEEKVIGALKKEWVEKLPPWLEKISRPELHAKIKKACLDVSTELLVQAGKHPLAFAHKANHPPRGKTPNVMICMHDYDVNEGAREALRMMNMDTEDPQKLERMAHFVRAAIPNVYLSNDIRDYERFDASTSARSKSLLKIVSSFAAGSIFDDPNEKAKDLNEAQMVDIVMKAAPTIALVATRDIGTNEELFLDYRLSSHVERPDWYVPVDEDAEKRRWS